MRPGRRAHPTMPVVNAYRIWKQHSGGYRSGFDVRLEGPHLSHWRRTRARVVGGTTRVTGAISLAGSLIALQASDPAAEEHSMFCNQAFRYGTRVSKKTQIGSTSVGKILQIRGCVKKANKSLTSAPQPPTLPSRACRYTVTEPKPTAAGLLPDH